MSVNKENSIGLAGGITGVTNISLSFVLSWFLAPLFVASSIVVIVLSAVGLKKAKQNNEKAGWSITGLATGIPTLIWNLFWTLVLIAAVNAPDTYYY